MLKEAFSYIEPLNEKYRQTFYDDFYKYFHGSYYYDSLDMENNTYNGLYFVSVSSNNTIVGYFHAKINRELNVVTSLMVVNFTKQSNIQFSKDLYKFVDMLFCKLKFNKINFSVYIGNPAERIYDKFINKYGGRVVGIYRQDVKLYDGTICDKKTYEIFRQDYIDRKAAIKWAGIQRRKIFSK